MSTPVNTDSRVGPGKLTFTDNADPAVTVNFSCQPTAIALVPTSNQVSDQQPVLCGDTLAPVIERVWDLVFSAVQDFDNAAGLIRWSIEHDLETVQFEWTPNATADKVSGKVQVQALQLGGAVKVRNVSETSWRLSQGPDFQPQTPTP